MSRVLEPDVFEAVKNELRSFERLHEVLSKLKGIKEEDRDSLMCLLELSAAAVLIHDEGYVLTLMEEILR